MATQLNKSMVSEVSIANQALGFLGSNPIISFDESSTSAQLMRDNYPFIRDAVMTEVAWTFATVRETSVTGDKSEWGDKFKHAVPVDWLQVLRVYRDVSSQTRKLKAVGWVREGNFVLTVEDTVFMWGLRRVTDTALFSASFVQCLATRIAADLCMAITENAAREQQLWRVYLAKLNDAAAADGVQGASEIIESNTLIDVRGRTDGGVRRNG